MSHDARGGYTGGRPASELGPPPKIPSGASWPARDSFRIYADFVDTYGAKVDVRESSLATERRVWIHAGDGAAHLNAEQARAVRDALDEWLNEFNGDPSPEAETKSTTTTHLGGPDCWCGDPTGHAAIANAALGITQGTPNG